MSLLSGKQLLKPLDISGSLSVTGSIDVLGAVSASVFSGSGAGLFNIPASGIVGLNLSQIVSGSVSASISPDKGFQVNTNSTFYGNQIISGSGFNTVLQVHGANDEPWAFGIYNDTYNPTQSVLAGWINNTGEANIGTEVDKPLQIYTNATYNAPTLTISSSGVAVNSTLTVTQGITGSLQGTASYVANSNIVYTSQSTETFNLANLEVLDYSSDVAVIYDNATRKLKFIFGTPQSSSITAFTFNSTFVTDRFDQQGAIYGITGSWSNGAYTLISASLYTGSVLISGLTNNGTVITQSFTGGTSYTTGSQQFRLAITSSNPLTPTPYYLTSSILTGTISKTSPGAPSITPSVSVQLGLSGTSMEENATGSIVYTAAYNATSNQWIQSALTTTASFGSTSVPLGSGAGAYTFNITGSATGSNSILSSVTASYTVPSASWTAAGQSTNTQRTAATSYSKIISIRSGSCVETGSGTTLSTGSLFNLRNWDSRLGAPDYDITGSIQLGTTSAASINNKQISITWTGDKYLYIIVASTVSITQIQQLSTPTNAFTHTGAGTTPTAFKIGNYNLYRTLLKQAGGSGTTVTYTLIAS